MGLNWVKINNINPAAIKPVNTKMVSIKVTILRKRARLDMLAMDDVIEKNTSGVTAVKIRFKKRSPKGFNSTARSFNRQPSKTPIVNPARRYNVKRWFFKKKKRDE